jgi:hypothetical protein
LKNPGGLVLIVRTPLVLHNGTGGVRIERTEKEKEQEYEGSQGFIWHCFESSSDWLRRLGAVESCNISHGHLGEVKEIVKKLGDDPFGMRGTGGW